jgi:predicted  nucleic acid-binding Zn-ribbon protein|mmetsp:Transcript_98110/g.155166  ORF Transcript_98110/g.155166 Transcript_98110/m.155166 type:complete len:718 (+) Transcript_98110:63-2216(+)
MIASSIVLVCALSMPSAGLAGMQEARANPIRKVVTMLQAMQKKVASEGEKEKELFDKYMCYCKTSGGALQKSVSDAETKIPEVGSNIKEAEAKNAQLKEDLKQHQVDRAAAKEAVASASALREKELAAYTKEASETSANIAAINSAVTALEKGMSGGFLQTRAASVVRHLAIQQNMDEEDRQILTTFLQGSQSEEFSPSSGQITGILKTMGDEMSKSLEEAKAAEAAAVAAFDELNSAKAKEIDALTSAIETKTSRIGDLSVEIVQMKNDLSDSEEALLQDKAFLVDLEKNCATKSAEWEKIVSTRNEELLALADTIKVLNDDDALELFKKTLPGASASFVQLSSSSASSRTRALAAIRIAQQASRDARPRFDFIALAIQGKKIGFDKVIKMIVDMVATLKKEQLDDENKKEYCAKQFDTTEDKKKSLEHSLSDLETVLAETKDSIASTKADIDALSSGIKDLDKAVAEATEQRKEENEDFTELMASDAAAKELLAFAKNRLNKFYNPRLYKAPPKRTLSEEDRITLNMGGTLAPTAAPGGIAGTGVTVLSQVREHDQDVVAPPPPPEAPGAYKKKTESSSSVIAMIDLLIKDLDKEMSESSTQEKDSQADYEKMMNDSSAKRAEDTKMLTEKGSTLAELESSLEETKEEKASATKELSATLQYIQSVHAECDWLMQYFDVRKEARDSEIDSLNKAQAVLSGADFSLLQRKSQKFLH